MGNIWIDVENKIEETLDGGNKIRYKTKKILLSY